MPNLLDCAHFEASRCRSCSWLETPYREQLARKASQVAELLGEDLVWDAPYESAIARFRNKAKLVVSGNHSSPTLGILGPDGGVDLRDCVLHEQVIQDALPHLGDFIAQAELVPYDITDRRGELKYLLVTSSPRGDLMVRFVLRSTESESRIRKHLDGLLSALPSLRVVSLNIQPEHKAILEGEREIVLTPSSSLLMTVNDVDLQLRPQSFFQTNTQVAAGLYRAARSWVCEIEPAPGFRAWDLYCGVGGFARHLATADRGFIGVEISPEAVASAQASAPQGLSFVAEDAFAFAEQHLVDEAPDLIVVNPPRRGIGALTALLEASSVAAVLYSSCNAESLARDLTAMPSLRPVRAQIFDMFPHTSHYEVLTLLVR